MRTALRILTGIGVGMVWWLVLTQDVAPLSIAGAAVLSAAAVAFAGPVFAEKAPITDARGLLRMDLFLAYLLLVLVQSYIASFELMWRMVTRRYRPDVVRVRTRLRSPLGRTLLANTISLIPGTLSLWSRGGRLYVHLFDARTTHAIRAGHMIVQRPERLLERIFG